MITRSRLEDNVWIPAKKSNGRQSINFKDVFARNPRMRETVKAYLWAKLFGIHGEKACSWGTISANACKLRSVAAAMERDGLTCFSQLTAKWVLLYWDKSGKMDSDKQEIGVLCGMFAAEKVPNLPTANPLRHIAMRDFQPVAKVTQTEFFTDEWFQRIVLRALEYRSRADGVQRLIRSRNLSGKTARRLGISNLRELNREALLCRAAGTVCVLAATGMRRCELLSLQVDALRQIRPDGMWVLWGMVYKFHGNGSKARWICGELGRIGHGILARLAGDEGPLLPGRKGGAIAPHTLAHMLDEWTDAQGWGPQAPNIAPHRFRRTLARLLFRNGVSILGVKEQFKHKTPWMSDYYIGNDPELYAKLLEGKPDSDLAASQDEMLRKLDAEDDQ
jgi:integrase